MATKIQFTKDQLTRLFGPTVQDSAFMKLVVPTITNTTKDHIGLSGSIPKGRIHVKGSGKKVVDDLSLNTFNVNMASFYLALTFDEFEHDDEEALVNRLIAKLPASIARTLDEAVFPGLVANSPFDFAGVENMTVDETVGSWIAVLNDISYDGYNPNSAVLDITLKDTLEAALNTGVQTNPLRESLADGSIVRGMRVYFRNGLGGKGIVFDNNAMAIAFKNTVEVNTYDADNSWELGLANEDGVITKWRAAVGISDPKAARFISAEAPAEG